MYRGAPRRVKTFTDRKLKLDQTGTNRGFYGFVVMGFKYMLFYELGVRKRLLFHDLKANIATYLELRNQCSRVRAACLELNLEIFTQSA